MKPAPQGFNLNSALAIFGIAVTVGGWVWFAAVKSTKIDAVQADVESIKHKLDGADIYKSAESERAASELAALKARVEMLTNVVMSDRRLAANAVRFSGPDQPAAAAAAPPQ